jgi:hypothetical protein
MTDTLSAEVTAVIHDGMRTLCKILGIDYPFAGLDLDALDIMIGRFVVAVISGADDEAEYFGGTA